jgi:cell division protein FtsB
MRYRMRIIFLVIVLVLSAYGGTNRANAADDEVLKQLKAIIEKQQEQLEAQQKAIEDLKQKVDALSQQEAPTTAPPEAAPISAGMVKSRGDKVAVKLFGHVNRALLVSNDGNDTSYYNVDNSHSQSRLGIDGTAKIDDHLFIGSKIELGLKSNPSGDVDQTDKNTNFDINERVVEIFLKDDRYGTLSIGQGHTASDGSSEVDLSGTAVTGYSDIPGFAGGQFFYDKRSQSLSDTRIRGVFQNMDGLSRQDRIRYDTPNIYGIQASGSVINNEGGDLALRYSAKFGDTLVAAAGAWASPGDLFANVDSQYNGSMSVLFGMGLNFTVAGGYRDLKGLREDDDATFFYGKAGYRRGFFSFGDTAFSVDYARHNDIAQKDDAADTIGLQMVQNLDPWGSEWYLGYRYHTLDRTNENFDDINAIMSGFRVKF